MGHGGAGSGKSTVIHLVAKWCHHILSRAGDNVDHPYILKTAFTGTAASNIDGQTLHTSFSFNFDNNHYSLSDKKRDEKRTIFQNLKILIIDEVSMVKSDMIYQLDLKLQELKERIGVPFGGVSILIFGDMLQLRPVLGNFPFEKPKNKEYHATFHLLNRWKLFKIYNLECNHRQGKDKDYADMLNRIRIGKMTDDDVRILKTRVRPNMHPDLNHANLFIVPIRKACAKYNLNHINSLAGKEIILKAIHYHPTRKNYKPFIDEKEGAISTTSFLDEIRVKLGCKIIIIHNIDTSDGLTNGQLGILVDIICTRDGNPDKMVVKLRKEEAGKENRKQYPNISKKFPGTVILERVSVNYSLRKKGGVVGSTATLIQFPIKISHAITSHKIQGQTIPKPLIVALNLKDIFEEAQGYVMLSRVQELNQVFIIQEFDPKKIYPSRKALEELDRMNKISINANPTPWKRNMSNSIKLLFMNCAGLKPHFNDITSDTKLPMADVISLLEISLEPNDNVDSFSLPDYNSNLMKIGKGKGIGTYWKCDQFKMDSDVITDHFQIVKVTNNMADIISIYRSQIANSTRIMQDLKELIDLERVTIIVGDLNVCYKDNFNNRLIQGLLHLGFSQVIHEPTHIQGRIIDQVFILDPNKDMQFFIEQYSPYYTDHDAFCITIQNNTLEASEKKDNTNRKGDHL